MAWLPLAALAVFLAEAATFIGLGNLIGYGGAVLVVVLASVLGIVLLRREGIRGWRRFRDAAAAGKPPGPQVANGVIGLVGALLLAVPGLLSSAAGLLLLIPPVRALARHRVQTRAERRLSSMQAGQMFGPRRVRAWQTREPAGSDNEVVEGEVIDPS